MLQSSDVLFEFDKATLTPEARVTVDEMSTIISRTASSRSGEGIRSIIIEGHTDSIGSDSYNERLSYDRAREVARALDLPRSAVTIVPRGEHVPRASNDTAWGREKNRRVEVIVENRYASERVTERNTHHQELRRRITHREPTPRFERSTGTTRGRAEIPNIQVPGVTIGGSNGVRVRVPGVAVDVPLRRD